MRISWGCTAWFMLYRIMISVHRCPPNRAGKNCNSTVDVCRDIQPCYAGSTCLTPQESTDGNWTCVCEPGQYNSIFKGLLTRCDSNCDIAAWTQSLISILEWSHCGCHACEHTESNVSYWLRSRCGTMWMDNITSNITCCFSLALIAALVVAFIYMKSFIRTENWNEFGYPRNGLLYWPDE